VLWVAQVIADRSHTSAAARGQSPKTVKGVTSDHSSVFTGGQGADGLSGIKSAGLPRAANCRRAPA
jgi:hypothetical protein